LILVVVGLALAGLAALYFWGPLSPAQEVAVTAVSKVNPDQAYTVLNASGYVVAQRKAAVSSKSTGRLARLDEEEGSRVKQGQIIAALENEDLVAARNQAQAQVREAEAGLVSAQAELADAQLQYQRYKNLVARTSSPARTLTLPRPAIKRPRLGWPRPKLTSAPPRRLWLKPRLLWDILTFAAPSKAW
jgi:multidrug efflux pump subunit AcrA (membrane-fusion protein)